MKFFWFNKHQNTFISSNDGGQLFLLGGIIITILLISLAAISSNIADIYSSVDNTDYLKSDYDNIRKEFGFCIQDVLEDKLQYVDDIGDEDIIITYFNQVRDVFIFAESLNGNDFYAEYDTIRFTLNRQVSDICVKLTYADEKQLIKEDVVYDLS